MDGSRAEALISFVGTLAQFGACVLLVTLFLMLRPYSRRRKYFTIWGQAWLAASIALGALVVRYNIMPQLGVLSDEGSPAVRVTYFTYQVAKIFFAALLLTGTRQLATGARPRGLLRSALVFSLVYGSISVYLSDSLATLVVWQAPIVVISFVLSAHALFMLPESRKTLGSHFTATLFAAMAVLWILYAFSFGPGSATGLGQWVMSANTFLDLLLHILLGYGMVVLLMEHAKREVDDAHAELAVAHHHLLRTALYDSLTGCLNRRAFSEGVGLEVARAAFGSVIMIDMDNLKAVNDTYGHAAGDVMLRHLAEVLRNRLRASDKLYRWGGDEFLVVLPGAHAADIVPSLQDTLARAGMVVLEDSADEIALEVSLGAADYDSGEALDAAIVQADAEMYIQKNRRRRLASA